MATTKNYIEYVCEQIQDIGEVRYRSMMGEYIVYINDKPIITVCDNTCYVKEKEEIEELMHDHAKGFPYSGARMHYILDIENSELAMKVLKVLEEITPLPKSKIKK